MFSRDTRPQIWFLSALSLLLITLGGTPLSQDRDAVAAPAPPCQNGEALQSYGHFFGWMATVAADPADTEHLYVGDGRSFSVLDISDLGAPGSLGNLSLGGGDVRDIVVVGSTAYAVNGDGLHTVDISAPAQPRLLGSLPLTGTVRALAVSGSYACVAGTDNPGDGQLHVVDVGDPERPDLITTYDTPGEANDVVLDPAAGAGEAIAYVDDGDDLLMVDLSDPGSPAELGTYSPPEKLREVRVVSATAYLITRGEGWADHGYLRIVDVSDPADPAPLGSYDALERGRGLDVVDTTAYVTDDEGVLKTLDVSDPADPQHLATHDTDRKFRDVLVAGTRAYIRAEDGVHIVDVSDPENPDGLGDYTRPKAVMDILVDYPTGYIAGWDRLWTIDLTDPAVPVPVGYHELEANYEEKELAIAPHPQNGVTLAYVAEWLYGLEVFDVDDPTNPTLLGDYPTPDDSTFDRMTSVSVLGDYAYVLTTHDGDGRLRILDVSDPTDPTEVKAYNTPGDARQVVVTEPVTGTSASGTLSPTQPIAFVADGEPGLRIIDVSDPDDPTELSHIDPPAGATTDLVTVVGDRAYVGSNTGTSWHLRAYNVADASNPAPLAEQQGTGQMNDLDVGDQYAYVAVEEGEGSLRSLAPTERIGPAMYDSPTGSVQRYDRDDLSSSDRYQTENADSVHEFSFTVGPFTFRFVIIDKHSYGMEVVGDPPKCSVSGVIRPEKAKADGCTMSPEGEKPCVCGQEEISFSASAAEGWEFISFSPEPPVLCPDDGQTQVVALFGPKLTVAGQGHENLCVGDEENVKTVLPFSLLASDADNWEVSSFTFEASGDGDDAQNIAHVKLFHEGSEIGGTKTYSKDNGTVQFEFSKIEIPSGGPPVNFSLEYAFDYEGMEECGTEYQDFLVNLKQHDALPQTFSPGVPSGGAAGGASIGCVMHEDAEGTFLEIFDTIQEAVDGAASGATVALCPGDYEENVNVGTSVKIHSVTTKDDTSVKAADANDHVFHVQRDNVTIDDLAIRDASGAGKAGVYVHGSTVRKASITNSSLMGHHHGILLESAAEAEIKDNTILSNEGHGIYLKSSTESTIEGNSISLNGENGLYMENCQEVAGKQTKITNKNAFRRNEKNGIHAKQSKGVVIDDTITISENGEHGVFLENAEDVEITNNPFIKQNEKDGIRLNSSKDVEIRDNAAIEENAEKGIVLYNCQPGAGEPPNRILGNTIAGNRTEGRQSVGIYIQDSTGVRVGSTEKPNIIRLHSDHGISLVDCHRDVEVRGNTLTKNDKSGIHLQSSCFHTIQENTVGPENLDGIWIKDSHCPPAENNSVVLNTVEGNSRDGILLEGSHGNQIGEPEKGNTIASNEMHGISLKQCEAPEGRPNRIRANVIRQNKSDGIYVEDSKYVVISDENQIEKNDREGIHLDSSTYTEIKENKIHGDYRQENGIYLHDLSAASIEGNEIEQHRQDGIHVKEGKGTSYQSTKIVGNIIEKTLQSGIELLRTCRVTIGEAGEGNTIQSTEAEGIRLDNCPCSEEEKNEIAYNTIKNTDDAHGVHVDRSRGAEIGPNNTIEYNNGTGLHISDSYDIEVLKNSIWNNQHGIHVKACQAPAGSENEILENLIQENAQHGIYLERSSGTKIGQPGVQVNTVRLNDRDGIHLEHCSSSGEAPANAIINNVINNGKGHGIYLRQSHGNLVKANEIRAHAKDGVHLKQSNRNRIEENTQVDQNGWHGIYLKWSEGSQIRKNHVEQNGRNGVFLYECSYNEGIAENEIVKNGESGIRLSSSHHNVLYSNKIRENTRHGIRIKHGRRNLVIGQNTIEKCGRHGIYVEGSPHTKIGSEIAGWIRDNAEYGVYLKGSASTEVMRWNILRNYIGVTIENTRDFNVHRNRVIDNETAFDVDNSSTGNNYIVQNLIRENGENSSQTGIHVTDSNLTIIGSTIAEDRGAGIIVEGDADLSIRKSNVYSNAGFGLSNMNPDISVDAQENWWGDPSGPGGAGPGTGEEVTGTVDWSNWRTTPVNLVAVALPETVLAGRGMTESNQIYIQNAVAPTDTVTVMVHDTSGWLLEPRTFTTTMMTSTVVSASFAVPVDAVIGASNEVTVTVRSHADPTAVDTTTFRVKPALMADLTLREEGPEGVLGPEIAHTIVVTNTGPDAASGVTITATVPLTATVVSAVPDQGTCEEQDGEVVCEVGAVPSGTQVSVDLVVRPNNDEGLHTIAEVSAAEADPDPSDNFDSAHTSLLHACLQALQELSAVGPSFGHTGVPFGFTAVITPVDATPPITYTWAPEPQEGQGTDSASYQWTTASTYTLTLTAKNCGGTVTDTHIITITTQNQLPEADAGPDLEVQVGEIVTLDGSGSSDPDGHLPLTFGWSQVGGPAVPLSARHAVSPTFTAPSNPAVLTFTLTVSDAYGLASTPDAVAVTINDEPITGLEAESSSPTILGQPTFFTATVTAGTNVSYLWAFGDGNIGIGPTISHTYSAARIYTTVVTASNGVGETIATTLITITNEPPVADAGPDQRVTVGDGVTLDGSGSADPDDHLPLAFGWSQVGGPTVALSSWDVVSPTLTAPGGPTTLTFTLKVTDAYGVASPSDAVTIFVEARTHEVFLPLIARTFSPAMSQGPAARSPRPAVFDQQTRAWPIFLPPPHLRD